MALAATKAQLNVSNSFGAQPAACSAQPDIVQTSQPLAGHGDNNSVNTGGQDDKDFARAFICWFYPLLNNADCDSDFGPHHFFNSCILKIAHGTVGADVNLEEHSGSMAVAQRLAAVVVDKKIKFCPNIGEGKGGYQGISNAVGLRAIKVCGTLHACEELVGVFEQEFGLVRDPGVDFNFRVKFSNLKLMAGRTNVQPTLELTGGMMILPHSG